MARRTFVKAEYGDEAWTRVLESLSPDDGAVFHGSVMAAAWYPFSLCRQLDEAVVEVCGGGNPTLFERIGACSAQENLRGPHKAFLTPGNPARFMENTEKIYRFYYDVGRRTWEPSGPTSGVMTTYDAETFSRTDCLTVVGWYKEALKMCGATHPHVEETTCRADGGRFCRYQVRWSD